MVEVGTRVFMGGFMEKMRFENNRRFKKDIQIQIDKPKYRETPTQSKTRHVDGGGRKPQFEANVLLPPKVKVFRQYTLGCSLF